MSTRRSRLAAAATAAPSPDTPPPFRLLDLPTDLLERALSRCDAIDIARVAAVSLLFHASLAEAGIRLRLQEAGYEPPAQPEGENCAVRWLCFYALLRESNPPARAAAGYQHSVFIDGEGRLSSCGSAATEGEEEEEEEEEEQEQEIPGLLGHGEGVTQLNTPTRLPSTLGDERAVSVSAGVGHSVAITADGAAWSWGEGSCCQLGHGDEQHQRQPKNIEAFAGRRVVAASAGRGHSLAITADGAVWSWGLGYGGKLGHGDRRHQLLPKTVEALAGQRVVAMAAGGSHSLAITADGAVWSWGFGGNGELGHGEEQSQLLPKKNEAFAGQCVVGVSAGEYHSLALTADGAVWSWGFGGHSRLGHSDQQFRQQLPKKVEAFAGQRVVAVSTGDAHSLALTADGAVWSWGEGSLGQLGQGNEEEQLLPKKVEALAGQRVVAVSAGGSYSIAITADGAAWSWGDGEHGCLGHGEDLSNQLLPKKIETWASRPPTPVSSDGSEEDE